MALILLRHTRPEGAEGMCYGRSDLPLAAGFDKETARLVRELPPFTHILSSPLSRCLLLAQALAKARACPLRIDPRLAEMDFGRWEGMRWDAIARSELDAWAADLTGARPHGGETVAELAARVRAALTDALSGPQPVLVVCHAGVIKAALAAGQGAAAWHAHHNYGTWLELGPGWTAEGQV
jgi:alpha-ribazole phosphatase